MGGRTFQTELAQDAEIVHLNIGGTEEWLQVISATGANDIPLHIRCRDDADGECESRGCLNSSSERAWELPIEEFLAMHKHALAVLQAHPEKIAAAGAKVNSAALLFKDLIARISHAVERGARVVIILDDTTCPDLYPCPRIWSSRRSPSTDELKQEHNLGGVISETFLSYEGALEKLRSGEWETNFKQAYWPDPDAAHTDEGNDDDNETDIFTN